MRKPEILLLVAIALVCAGIFLGKRSWFAVSDRLAARGEIVRIEQKLRGSGKNVAYHSPVVRYRTDDGKPIEAKAPSTGSRPIYRPGQKVALLYDPEKPERVLIYSFGTLWAAPLALGGLGLVLMVAAVILMGTRKRSAAT